MIQNYHITDVVSQNPFLWTSKILVCRGRSGLDIMVGPIYYWHTKCAEIFIFIFIVINDFMMGGANKTTLFIYYLLICMSIYQLTN